MRKRLIEKLTKARQGSLGYTLTELLVTIAIIAIACAIAIPSVFWLSRTLRFKERNDYAKSIFMAAQQNLSEMRANGQLELLQTAGDAAIPAMTERPDGLSNEYRYSHSSITLSGDSADTFGLILPPGSVDSTARNGQIIIEYNPLTGNVFSVFYSEEKDSILRDYIAGTLPRDEEDRRDMLLGYYDGSGLDSSLIVLDKTQATVELVNGEEALIRVTVPMPEAYYDNHTTFTSAMKIDLTISGQITEALHLADPDTYPNTGRFTIPLDVTGATVDLSGMAVVVEYPIDSLMDKMSFANYSSGTQAGATVTAGSSTTDVSKHLTELTDESAFAILPGDNITIQADVTFTGTDVLVEVESGLCPNVNPMFGSLVPTSGGKYILSVANGRHLQNLNAICPTIAKLVSQVVFTDDINWATTVSYYNKEYKDFAVDGIFYNSGAENPARALPYFVPIHCEDLFGTATFVYPGPSSSISDWEKQALQFLNASDEDVPTLTDEADYINGITHASIQGNGHKVYNINIDATTYEVPNADSPTHAGKFYATGDNYTVDYCFTGLFGYVNTTIDDLELVNPIVKGRPFATDTDNPATGSLLGAGGYGTLITNCGVYVDRYASGYDQANHSTYTYDNTATLYSTTEAQNYGVTGQGAVGGLVGFCKSHLSVTGDLDGDTSKLAFSHCFAAVPVSGNMRGNTTKDFGYSNGVGGLLGNSQLTNFYNCYASGDVRASGCLVTETSLQSITSIFQSLLNALSNYFFDSNLELLYNGRDGMGVGGFVGTSHGTRYTNCFATGDVSGTTSANTQAYLGAGGFVGFMSIDEDTTYGHGGDNATVAQRTVFTNCYAVGVSVTNGSNYENFCGAAGRITLNFAQSTASFYGNYYHLYAPHYCQNGTDPDYEDFYIFRDTYYLSNYQDRADDDAQEQSSTCAEATTYAVLTDLPGSHTYKSDWSQERLTNVRGLSTVDSFWILVYSTTYERKYFDNGDNTALIEAYYQKYSAGYSSDVWEPATSSTTQSFSYSAIGSVYPFSKLKGMDYYGDWPSCPSDIGITYYETYADTGNTHFLFDIEHDGYAHLSLRDITDEDEAIVQKDGYAILSASNTALYVTVGDPNDPAHSASGTLYPATDEALDIDNKIYYVFYLTDALMSVQSADGEFYLKVTAQHPGEDVYTMYFNPDVALSHANPVDTGTAGTSTSAKEPDVPTDIDIRSARQFAALGKLIQQLNTVKGYDLSKFNCHQNLHIDASQYQWGTSGTQLLASIGTAELPFQGLYLSISDSVQAEIRGFGLAENSSGIFHTLGESAILYNIKFVIDDCISVTVNEDGTTTATDGYTLTSGDFGAVVVGKNKGTLTNVDLEITADISITASQAAGLLAGYSSGTVTDCDVTFSGNVALTAPITGGYIGQVVGIEADRSNIQGGSISSGTETEAATGTLTLGTASRDTVRYAGGFLGHAYYTTAEDLFVSLGTVTVNADWAGGLAAYAENATFSKVQKTVAQASTPGLLLELIQSAENADSGSIAGVLGQTKNVTLSSILAQVGTVQGDTAAGLLGSGEGTNASGLNLTITGTISGKTSAAGMVTSLGEASSFNRVSVDLSNATITSEGKAAGYAIELKTGTLIQNSNVTLAGTTIQAALPTTTGETDATAYAAGYAYSISGSVQTSGVMGKGTISAQKAAGFAITLENAGRTSGCSVTPALSTDDYAGNSNANLTIQGSEEAAGFALMTVGVDTSISNCYALGTITAPAAAGFVLTNGGSIELSTANVAIENGYAFVAANNGMISRCYGWYADSVNDGTETIPDFAEDSTGACYSCYFANLYPAAKDAESDFVVLYTGGGTRKTVTTKHLASTDLETGGLGDLINDDSGTARYIWFEPGKYSAYPYDQEITEGYDFPMVSYHYGDWVQPPKYAYGIAYYEVYSDPNTLDKEGNPLVYQKIRLLTLSGNKTQETLSGYTLPTYLVQDAPDGTTSEFDATGNIVRAGYAIFRQRGSDYLNSLVVGTANDLASFTLDGLDITDATNPFIYDFYTIDTTKLSAGILNISGAASSLTLDTRFADSFNPSNAGLYIVRTEDQLKNVSTASNGDFLVTHAIQVEVFESSDTVQNLSGTFAVSQDVLDACGTEASLTFQSLRAPLFASVSGEVKLGHVTIDQLGEGFIAASNGTVSIGNITVNGLYAAESSDVLDSETAGIPEESTSETQGDELMALEETESTSALFGDLSGTSFTTGTITIQCDIGQVFGDVKTALTTGKITVNGNVGQIYGGMDSATSLSVTGEPKIAIQVTGNVTGSVVGQVEVANVLTVPSPIHIGGMGQSAKLLTGLTSGTLTFGDVTIGGSVGTLFGPCGGHLNGGQLTITGTLTGNLFQSVTNGSLNGFQIQAASGNISLSGSGSAGLLLAELPAGSTVSGCAITLTSDAASSVELGSGGIFGGLVGVSEGTVENCSVDADFTVSGSGTIGGLVGQLVGGKDANDVETGKLLFTIRTQEDGSKLNPNAVNVDITYSGEDKAVTIGGLVGQLLGGTIQAPGEDDYQNTNLSPISLVSGGIHLAENTTGSVKDYTVGGVIGEMDHLALTDSSGNALVDSENNPIIRQATVSNVQASVTVDALWKGANTAVSGTVNTGCGPVAMFVGYAANGSLTDCASTAANETFQFLGEAAVVTGSLGNDLWKAENSDQTAYNGEAAVTLRTDKGDIFDASGKKYTAQDGIVFTPAGDVTYSYVAVELNNCTFYLNTVQMLQDYAGEASRKFYSIDGPTDIQTFAAELLTVTFTEKTDVTRNTLTGWSTTRKDSNYYVLLTDGTYVRLQYWKTETGGKPKVTKYYVGWGDVSVEAKNSNTNIYDLLKEKYGKLGSLGTPTLTTDGTVQYLVVRNEQAYTNLNSPMTSVAFKTPFTQDDDIYNARWTLSTTKKGRDTYHCWTLVTDKDITFEQKQAGLSIDNYADTYSSLPAATYKIGNNNYSIYKVIAGTPYSTVTFTPTEAPAEMFSRQALTATEVTSTSSTGYAGGEDPTNP